MWGTANYESLKAPFEQAFRESGKPEKHRATFRNSFKKKEFLKLSEEEQKKWADDAIEAHNTAKKVWEGGKEMSPAEAQAYVKTNVTPLMIADEFAQSARWSPKSSGTAAGKHRTSAQDACFGVCGRPRAKVGGEDQHDKVDRSMLLFHEYVMLTIHSVHHGVNKAPSPQVWPLADKAKFTLVRDSFIEFLNTCYCRFSLSWLSYTIFTHFGST